MVLTLQPFPEAQPISLWPPSAPDRGFEQEGPRVPWHGLHQGPITRFELSVRRCAKFALTSAPSNLLFPWPGPVFDSMAPTLCQLPGYSYFSFRLHLTFPQKRPSLPTGPRSRPSTLPECPLTTLYFTGAITGLFLPLDLTPLGQRPCLCSFNSDILHRPGTQYVRNNYLLKAGNDNLCPTVQCTGFAEKTCFMLRSPLMKNKTNLPIAILNPSVFLIE